MGAALMTGAMKPAAMCGFRHGPCLPVAMVSRRMASEAGRSAKRRRSARCNWPGKRESDATPFGDVNVMPR